MRKKRGFLARGAEGKTSFRDGGISGSEREGDVVRGAADFWQRRGAEDVASGSGGTSADDGSGNVARAARHLWQRRGVDADDAPQSVAALAAMGERMQTTPLTALAPSRLGANDGASSAVRLAPT